MNFTSVPNVKAIERSPVVRPATLIVVCVAAIMAAVALRVSLVRIAPRSAVLFEVAGMTVNLAGLDIDHVAARIAADGDRRILVVEGDVVNPTDDAKVIPAMQVSVRGNDGRPLYAWSTRAPKQRIEPGERAAFVARLASPPLDGAGVEVKFDRAVTPMARRAPPAASSHLAKDVGDQGSRTESQ